MGRLIDADKLLMDIEKYHVSDGKFQHWVQIQPTIKPQISDAPDTNVGTSKYTVSATAVEEMLKDLLPERGMWEIEGDEAKNAVCETVRDALEGLWKLPFVKPEPLSNAYIKAVWTWLIDYQIKAAELKGRYTPYEVLSWVANDWRKEHERSN